VEAKERGSFAVGVALRIELRRKVMWGEWRTGKVSARNAGVMWMSAKNRNLAGTEMIFH
jgi:hypothetical protein